MSARGDEMAPAPRGGRQAEDATRRAARHAAELLRAGARAHAAGAVLRQGAAAGDGDDAPTFDELVRDAEHRVRCLAEALSLAQPEIFHEHVRWSKVAFAARGMDDAFLEQSLEALGEELAEGLPAGARPLVRDYLASAATVAREAPSRIESHLVGEGPELDLARRFLLAILEGRGGDAIRLMVEAADAGSSVQELYAVIERVQREVGRMWQMGEVTIAEEHFGSRIVETVISRLQEGLPAAGGEGPSVLLATVGGDLHDIGPRMVADQFELAGWRVYFLGANTPTTEVLRTARDRGVDVIAISASLQESASAAADLVATLRRELGDDCPKILVGGNIFTRVADLWKDVGADALAATAAEAPRIAAELAS